jgi:hypothetical protein
VHTLSEIVVFLALATCSSVFGQEPFSRPGELLRKTTHVDVYTESVLSGIDIYADNVQQVISRLGRTSLTTDEKGERVYVWGRGACILRLWSLSDGRISAIEVSGNAPESQIGISGKGLNLGDKIEDLRRVYPALFQWRLPRIRTESKIYLQIVGDDCPPVLRIEFGDAGSITRMPLGPVFYCW